jgi:hypothetical protein
MRATNIAGLTQKAVAAQAQSPENHRRLLESQIR